MSISAVKTPHFLDDSAFVIPHPAPINYTNIQYLPLLPVIIPTTTPPPATMRKKKVIPPSTRVTLRGAATLVTKPAAEASTTPAKAATIR